MYKCQLTLRDSCVRIHCEQQPLPKEKMMEDLRRAFHALGNRKRLKIMVSLLESGEASVGQLSLHHRMPITTASRHLKKLEGAGLVRGRQQGTYVFYSADTLSRSSAVRGILATLRKSPKRRVK